MNKHQDWLFLLACALLLIACNCRAGQALTPPQEGNFALPTSQQPGPLISFGQNILNKNEIQLFISADDYAGVNKHFIDVIPAVLYGISDNLSLLINTPYAASFETGSSKSTGFEDAFAQLEYVFYNGSNSSFSDQATIVINVAAPTGSIRKDPATGNGSFSYFLGTTFNSTSVKWYYFVSPGAIFTTVKNGTKVGNSYLYQAGLGRNIANWNGWLFAWVLEGDGTYTEKNKIGGMIDPNSGGNVVYVTPSLWAATKKFLFQFGVGLPVTQHLFGSQSHGTLLVATNIGWSFY